MLRRIHTPVRFRSQSDRRRLLERRESNMSAKEHKGGSHHETAAEHHETAAHHHREAAKHYEHGDHEKAGHRPRGACAWTACDPSWARGRETPRGKPRGTRRIRNASAVLGDL